MRKLKLIITVLLILSPLFSFSQVDITKEQADQFRQQLQFLQNVQASNFTLSDTTGKMLRLEEFRNKVIIFDFWSTSCAPCIRDFPYFNKIKDFYKDSTNIAFINICIDKIEREPQWKSLIKEHHIGGTHLFLPINKDTPEENNFYLENIKSFPTYLLVSKAGIILGELPNVESFLMPYAIGRGFNNNSTSASFDEFLTSNDVFKEWASLNMSKIIESSDKK